MKGNEGIRIQKLFLFSNILPRGNSLVETLTEGGGVYLETDFLGNFGSIKLGK